MFWISTDRVCCILASQIYGGYYTGFGAIWTRADFGDHDWWCSKLSSMLVTGSQLGWFSLAGKQCAYCVLARILCGY
jgi:hypothetical protein